VSDIETLILRTQFCKQLVYTTLDSYVEESHEVNVRSKNKRGRVFRDFYFVANYAVKVNLRHSKTYLLEIKQFWAQTGKCETVVPNLFESLLRIKALLIIVLTASGN
jgi:hypothetical protein